jgi:hypothetical protein
MTAANWRERYTASVLRSYFEYMKKNEEALVKTRQLTKEEIEKIFGDNPEYGKEIEI